MPVIVFASSKGGAGKTTACVVLTCELARQGKTKNIGVSLIDADPNQHSAAWARKKLQEALDYMREGDTLVVWTIITPGKVSDTSD